ncbi:MULTISPECIES: [LysW]-aminoadipate kinase [unclassified Streptomyces]|uniref:[LysW]-aminoadipate kinase n=1 Tax=unclassified Streptomyces TaxID=2593676 RepID=UPI000DAE8ED6|nr:MULTISPECIES: [LysW]-aminoadipate kinase [unclassified Streptomyces]PZT71790.1 acetylglutamate kinase [Streptomyces sp. AC1-42T]PZT73085.1 acetylglutamate kinase [Streptomyces sp. AC1-42W]
MTVPRIVVKWGGSLQENGGAIADDIAALWRAHRIVVVHGGSRDIDETVAELGLSRRTLTSPDGMVTRYTDAPTLSALMMAMRGRTQPRIVSELAARGVTAVGLSGMDGGLVRTERKTAVRAVFGDSVRVVRDNLAGRIVGVDTRVLDALHACGMLPVACPPGMTSGGQPTNVDADRMACAIAAAWRADRLLLFTDTPGVLTDRDDPGSTIASLSREEARSLLPELSGGMRMKVAAAVEALGGGAQAVQVCDGRVHAPVAAALRGSGTLIGKAVTS